MKTLQDKIKENFDAGLGSQALSFTVTSVSDQNIELNIDGEKFTVTGNTISHIDAPVITSAQVDAAMAAGEPSPQEQVTHTEGGPVPAGLDETAADATADEGNSVADVEGLNTGAPADGLPEGYAASEQTALDTLAAAQAVPDNDLALNTPDAPVIAEKAKADHKFQEVMTYFRAEDLVPAGERAETGEDRFNLLDIAGDVVASGTLREIEDRMNTELNAPKSSEGTAPA